MKTRAKFCWSIVFLLAQGPVAADEVTITLRELEYNRTAVSESVFVYNLDSFQLATTTSARNTPARSINKYHVRDRKLHSDGRTLADADEMLVQCTVGDFDLVVVRDEYNSFANPLHIFGAMIGHPVQVSKILLIQRRGDKPVKELEILRKHSVYEWSAGIHR